MAPTTARELRARLRGRRAALDEIGGLFELSAAASEASWWPTESAHDMHVAWMKRFGPIDISADRRAIRLRDGAEAIALLTALAQIDFEAFLEEHNEIWNQPDNQRRLACSQTGAASCRNVVVGYEYVILSSYDFAPISERVAGVELPTPQFLEDVAWLQRQQVDAKSFLRPTPVWLRICLLREDARGLAFLLRQIVQSVVTQKLFQESDRRDDPAQAAATASRFEIVQVDVEGGPATASLESLGLLTRLVQLGIRVGHLPTICVKQPSMKDKLALLQCLHDLLLPKDPSPAARVSLAYVSCDASLPTIPATFSAIQASPTVKRITLVPQRDDWDRLTEADRVVTRTLWQWAAYVLFSKHAARAVTTASLRVDHLHPSIVATVKRVVECAKPLCEIFEIGNKDTDGPQSIQASRFRLDHVDESADRDDPPIFTTKEPIVVRRLGSPDKDAGRWHQVLLPGYGEAWVDEAHATHDSRDSREPLPPLELILEGVAAEKLDLVLTLLGLVTREVKVVELEEVDSAEASFDVSKWILELLRLLPKLSALHLPWHATIHGLSLFVEAAASGHCQLKCLSLGQPFTMDTTDIVDFLGVLGDVSHLINKHLEDFSFSLTLPSPLPSELTEAWLRMLERNRSLHTLTVSVSSDEQLACPEDPVAIRTGPVPLASKLAFLSVVHADQHRESARSRLDASVMAIIFTFAAPHRLRMVRVVQGSPV